MILIWFVYGLAFFVLGLVILVYPKKGSRFALARHIWMVGAFGIIHGLNEWLDMFIAIGAPLSPDLMAQARMVTLASSFFFLLQFGVTLLAKDARKHHPLRLVPWLLLVGWLALVLLSGPPRRLLVGDIWARYLLCVPGAFLTAWGLAAQSHEFRGMRLLSVTRDLTMAAAVFLVYGVLAGIFVKGADFFPARVLNYQTFLALTGLPVQVFRALCAVLAAWSIIRMLDVFRWETQEALRISELRCATIASALPVFLFMVDRDTVVTFIQGKGLEALGLSPERMRGRPIGTAFPGGEESLVEGCRQALAGRELITTVSFPDAQRRCGRGVSFEICYSPLKDQTGAITHVVGVALDVSTRLQAQSELEEYRRKVEKHAREAAVGVLSATMARQVLEPLTITQLVLERALTDGSGAGASEAVRNGIGRGLSELSQARETLNRFMEMAHPDLAAAEQPVGLYGIAKRTMSVFADSALRRRVTIAIKDMDVVPLMAVSPREVEQIFYHMIQRAIDAADGDTEQKLVIACSVDDGHVELSFCDTCGGAGREGAKHHAGEGLRDLDGIDGPGLGLAVVKGIVMGHGGQVTIESGSGSTTFRVRLPAGRVY